jgi:hypothetical protein
MNDLCNVEHVRSDKTVPKCRKMTSECVDILGRLVVDNSFAAHTTEKVTQHTTICIADHVPLWLAWIPTETSRR